MRHELYRLLDFLDGQRLHYHLDRYRPECVCVTITMVGERLEVDVFEDEHLEIARFIGDESLESGDRAAAELYARLGLKS